MKILKQFEIKLNKEQLLSWLCWIQAICQCCPNCFYCPLRGPDTKGVVGCRVRNIYRETHPELYSPLYPDSWRLSWPEYFRKLIKPGDLDFLRAIKWNDRGDPIPELKEGAE